MKLIEIVLEIIGWLQIAIGTTIIAGLMAYLIYLKWNNQTGKTIAIALVSVGFILGAIWATRIWKRHGTIAWLSRIRDIS